MNLPKFPRGVTNGSKHIAFSIVKHTWRLQRTLRATGVISWLALPAILILAIPALNLIVLKDFRAVSGEEGIIGGPEESAAPMMGGINEAAAGNMPMSEEPAEEGTEVVFPLSGTDALLASGMPIVNGVSSRQGIISYSVASGDTISSIAVKFGITPDTVYAANPARSGVLRVGEVLNILPVAGALHEAKDGETVESVAALYGVEAQIVSSFNKRHGVLTAGELLIIPGAKSSGSRSSSASAASKLPSYPGYFAMPATGWNWGRLHNYNAVDIANSCGTEIYSAAEGLVVESANSGWNQGYGNYVKIEHPNGASTLYAHTKSNTVREGDYVQRGDLIAYIGNTGKTHGPTGCHLHFEVRGARNPLAK